MLCCGIQNQGFNCSMLASSSLTCIFQTPYDGAKTAPIAGDVVQFDGLNWVFAPMASVSFDDNQLMSLTNTNTISGTMVASAPVGADNQVNYTLSINARLDPSSTFPLTSSGAGIAVGTPTTAGTQGVLGGTGVANTYIGADGLLHLLPVSSTVTTGNLTSTTTGLSLTGNTGAVVGAGTTIDYNLVTGVGALTAGVQGTLGGTGTANTYVGADGQLHLLPVSATLTTFDLISGSPTVVTVTNGTDAVVTNDVTIDVATMVGATPTTDGVEGLVPAPLTATDDDNKFLRGNGTWDYVSLSVDAQDTTIAQSGLSAIRTVDQELETLRFEMQEPNSTGTVNATNAITGQSADEPIAIKSGTTTTILTPQIKYMQWYQNNDTTGMLANNVGAVAGGAGFLVNSLPGGVNDWWLGGTSMSYNFRKITNVLIDMTWNFQMANGTFTNPFPLLVDLEPLVDGLPVPGIVGGVPFARSNKYIHNSTNNTSSEDREAITWAVTVPAGTHTFSYRVRLFTGALVTHQFNINQISQRIAWV